MMDRLTLGYLPPGHFCTYAHHDYRKVTTAYLHDHDFYEFFWVEAGEGFHWINGQKLLIRQGDLILIQAADAHSFSATVENGLLRIVNFAFFASLWRDFHRRYFQRAPVFFSAPSLASRTYALNPEQTGLLHQAATQLRAGRRDRLQVESFLLAILALLSGDRFQSSLGSAPAWLRQACADLTLDRNFAGGMPALARLAGRSPEHIAREFRRHLGRTPTEVINDARMGYAAERLSTSEETIVSIALDCGLENLSHFYRLFRSRYGLTPRTYRLQQQRIGGPIQSGRRASAA